MRRTSRLAHHALVVSLLATLLGACASSELTGPLVLDRQGSFFVGGRAVTSDTLSTVPAFAASGTVTVDQMYVRYQVPVHARRVPLTLIHGCCLTGKTWETTPDGRMGWDEYFVRRGHPVYVVDQVSRGRSAANTIAVTSVLAGKTPASDAPPVFLAAQEAAWSIFRFGPAYPQVFPGMRFPLEAIDEFWKQMVPDWHATLPSPNPTVPALAELAADLNATILVSHSQSGIYPFQVLALSGKGVAAVIAIEPAACPSATDDLEPYLKVPILVLWGDYVDQSPRWAPRWKGCEAFAQAARRAGGRVDNIALRDEGFEGNSHMLMQDTSSLEVADWLEAWIDRNVARFEAR